MYWPFVQSRQGGARRIDSRWTEPRTSLLWGFDHAAAVPDRLYRPDTTRCKHFPSSGTVHGHGFRAVASCCFDPNASSRRIANEQHRSALIGNAGRTTLLRAVRDGKGTD